MSFCHSATQSLSHSVKIFFKFSNPRYPRGQSEFEQQEEKQHEQEQERHQVQARGKTRPLMGQEEEELTLW